MQDFELFMAQHDHCIASLQCHTELPSCRAHEAQCVHGGLHGRDLKQLQVDLPKIGSCTPSLLNMIAGCEDVCMASMQVLCVTAPGD